MKLIKYLAWTIIALFVLIPSTIAILVMTSTGSQFVIEQSARLAGIELEFDSLDGNLVGQLTLENLKVRQAPWQIRVKSLSLEWQPSQLIDSALVFKKIESRSFQFELTTTDATSTSSDIIELPQLELPIAFIVENLSARTNTLVVDDVRHQLPDIGSSFDWRKSKISIKQLELDYQRIDTSIAGTVTTQNDYPINLELTWQISDPIAKSAIEGVTGKSRVRGTINNLDALSTLTVPPQTDSHTVHLQIKDTLTKAPSWLAEVAINELSTAPLLPIVLPVDSPWYNWLNSSTLTLEATIDNQQAAVRDFVLSGIGNKQGDVTFNGVLSNYLAFRDDLSAVSLRGALTSQNLIMPAEAIGLPLSIDKVSGNIEGSLEAFDTTSISMQPIKKNCQRSSSFPAMVVQHT